MIKTKIRLGGIYFNRRDYVATCFQWRDNETVWIEPLPDNELAVYNERKRLICRTKQVAYPANYNYEYVDGERLIIEDEAFARSQKWIEDYYRKQGT